jgi:predicted acetyltransferase
MAAVLGAPVMRILDPADEAIWTALARLDADAYPILEITSAEELATMAERIRAGAQAGVPVVRDVVAERGGALAGAMRLFDYTMNVRGTDALAGGVGSVAVDLAHKRQGVARALIRWYLDHYRERGAPFAILHPFRLDFYRKLGFGYGTPMHRYRFAPAALRANEPHLMGGAHGTARSFSARALGPADVDAVLACTERVRPHVNGLIAKHRHGMERALVDAKLRYVGVEDAGVLRGYMQTTVEVDMERRNRDALIVRDVHAEGDAAFAALLAYLRAQRDQFARIVIESQDESLYLATADPRDGSDVAVAPPAAHRVAETGLGIMYRVLDVERAFAHLPAADAPFTLRLDVEDPFYPATHGTWAFRFGPHGAPRPVDGGAPHDAAAYDGGGAMPDATLRIGIADLSSLVVGSLDLPALVRHRLATLEPASALPRVARAFAVDQRPVCNTRF